MKNDPATARLLFGVALASLGLLFLLDNLHVFSARHVLSFWPVLLIAAGTLKCAQARHPNGTLVGIALIVVGTLLTLSHMGVFHMRWRDWWPLVLIGLGALVIFNGQRRQQPAKADADADGAEHIKSHADQVQHTTLMGGTQTRIDSQNFQGGEVTVVMGGMELDLRAASLNGEARLQVFVAMGGLELHVPADWTVIVDVVPVLGATEDKTIPAAQSTKRLRLSGYVFMGGIEIKP